MFPYPMIRMQCFTLVKKILLIYLLLIVCSNTCFSQYKTENVVIVTMDGMRWQEVFTGADSALLFNKAYTRDINGTAEKFWDTCTNKRREMLFPFVWSVIAKQGQLHGNRNAGSLVNVANPYRFSYPGYNEIFTGYPDTAVDSNDKIINKNINVLEFINQQEGYKGKVAVFSTWDVFPYILNKWRSGIYMNSNDDLIDSTTDHSGLINDIQTLSSKPIDVRLDVLTYIGAREYLKVKCPKVLCIGFDETDDFAHKGDYEQYLKSAHSQDAMIADLWHTLQSLPQYKDKTTLIITCDHGRGDKIKDNWTDHGDEIMESGEIWMAAIGPDMPVTGEVKQPEQIYQKQLAPTIAKLIGFDFINTQSANAPIAGLLKLLSTVPADLTVRAN